MKTLDEITGAIVDAAMKIHVEIGPGLLESVYEAVLARALERRGLTACGKSPARPSAADLPLDRGGEMKSIAMKYAEFRQRRAKGKAARSARATFATGC
jgi:hypothetical protein